MFYKKIIILISLENKTDGIRAFTAITLSMVLYSGLGASIESAFANPGQGTIFAVEPFSFALYTVSNAGVFTFVGNTGASINTLAYDPSSQIMCGGEGGGGAGNPNAGNLHIVDQTNGATTLVGGNGLAQSFDALGI